MRRVKKFFHFIRFSPILSTISMMFFTGIGFTVLIFLYIQDSAAILFGFLFGLFLGGPVTLTVYNIFYLFTSNYSEESQRSGRRIEFATVLFGAACSFIWSFFTSVQWNKNWTEKLYNDELHTPIATWTLPTLITVIVIAFVGYMLLRIKRINKMPPLLATFAIGATYLGVALCLIWIIQVIKHDFFLSLYPANLILIAIKTVKETVFDFGGEQDEPPCGKSKIITALYRLFLSSENWPWLGVICALPLLGIIVAVLILFGQAPDSIIRAWTETADWTFSQKVAPQNIHKDMHYLCTVAAGGHKKVVRPLRVGMRHGNRVVVNRQLCIANAFEQFLEERIPRIHRAIRRIYDRYGYPVAKHIKSPYAADIVYFLMKPLEWLFLVVLYLFDVKPENRIAVQYPHVPLPEMK